ncbi:hypothetical protein RGU12_04220 [Fredinandcohnia sp. QZ13]|uniref:hypothetical protein n=1 Tax=Fredinandcohnia sp. QZ13 TaxID=3073144 RepID=UPI00285349DC|nr:hypothetical protein [Fredinandcohnia sp. QZ13]MDR4886758.1 hypothetical protein [Fredinandcohnia sp. QZ13]
MKLKTILILIPLLLVLLYSFTYVPHKLFDIHPSDVSKIHIVDGNSGFRFDITSEEEIHRIIKNLNEVTFKKGKPSVGYMGYRFNTTIYNKKGEPIKELIINSNDTIRYKGFFYTTTDIPLEYDFIDEVGNQRDGSIGSH